MKASGLSWVDMPKMKTKFKETEIGLLPEEWGILKVVDIGRVVTGKTPPTKNRAFYNGTHPFIRIPDMGDSVYVSDSEVTLSDIGAEYLKRSLIPADSVMVSCIATIGRVGLTSRESFTNQQINSIIPDHELVDPKYLYYYFNHSKEYLISLGGGGSVYTNISKSKFENLYVSVPKIGEQKAIAEILSSLDDKIELNRQMNKTLESIAQALFKQWFVDFEFPDKHGKPYKSNGGKMVKSDLGEIPKGWAAGTYNSVLKISIGGDWGEEVSADELVPTICLRGTDLEHLKGAGYSGRAPIRYIAKASLKKRQITDNDIVIGGSGVGPVGKTLYFSREISGLYDLPVIYSNFCKRFSAKDADWAIYAEKCFEMMYRSGEMQSFINGTSIPNLDSGRLLNSVMLLPEQTLIEKYGKICADSYTRKYSKENQILTKLRDLLQPRLMNGTIAVK